MTIVISTKFSVERCKAACDERKQDEQQRQQRERQRQQGGGKRGFGLDLGLSGALGLVGLPL